MMGAFDSADKLTKLGCKSSHGKFRTEALGLKLLPEYQDAED